MDLMSVTNGIINGHRMIIFERYDFDRISELYDLPMYYTRDQSEQFRNYFMEYVYPDPTRRQELEEAFGQLDNYIKSPEKIMRILADSIGIMVKFGRHFPKIITAGLRAMKSYRSANKLENLLVDVALESNAHPPYATDEMKSFMTKIPDSVLNAHMSSIWPLYDVLLDRELVRKILRVVDALITKMEKRPNIYQASEVEGIKVGREVIEKGAHLFEQFEPKQLEELIGMITRIEKDAYKEFMSEE